MNTMKRKIKENKAKLSEELEEPEVEENKEEESRKQQGLVNALSHPGEFNYQMLMKFQELLQVLTRLTKAEERRNEIAEEEYSEEDEA